MSSQMVDVLFGRALDAMPSELSLALRAAGLDDAGILDSYPRDSYDVLVAAGVAGIDMAARGTLTGTGDDMDVVLATSAGTFYFFYLTAPSSLFFSIVYLFVVHHLSVVRPVLPLLPSCLVSPRRTHRCESEVKLGVFVNSGAIAEERGSKKHRRVTKSGRARMEKESSRVGVATQNTVDEELRDSRKSDAGTAFFEISEKCEELRQVSAEMSSDKNPDARGLSSGLRSVVSAPSSVPVKLEAGVAGSSTQGFEKDLVAALPAPPDVLLLYWTLVRDGVLPKGV